MIEPWFKVLMSAFLPLVVAFFLPTYYAHCLAASALLVLIAIVMMVSGSRRENR